VERFAPVSTVRIATAREEIQAGDRLVPAPREQLINYVPHAPARPVNGRIIATSNDAIEAGRGWIVTINKGAADGLDTGAVLAIYRVVPGIPDTRPSTEQEYLDPTRDQTQVLQPVRADLAVPDERTGLVFVFRVFDRLSYGIVLNTTDPVMAGDFVRNP
jgi:hypothetical protein